MLAMIVAMLVIVSSDVETRIEQEVVETVEVVHHSSASSSSSVTSTGLNNIDSNSINNDNNNNGIIGFHEPSFENMYGANYYFKPKGVGYPLAPTGGVHPIT